MAQTVLVRGEGGCVIEMDLPLSAPIQERLDKGELAVVEPEAPEGAPARTSRKSAS